MTPPWGINWLRYHADRQDMPHIERMGYRSFTIYEWMWNNRDFCNELLSVARQDAIFLNRDHPLSEQKDDLWKSDPARKGRNHADEWAQKVRENKVHTPLDRTYFLGLNEPDSEHFQRQIDAYNEAYCRRMTEHGLRVAAYSFGVGHPSTVGLQPKAPVDWSWYEASAAAILEGDHIAAFHEYGEPNGYGWGYWCNRILACPYPFRVVFDECGIDNGVLQSGQLYGWAKYLKPEEYLRWLDGFQKGMAERAILRKVKILGYNIFSFDHGSGKSKDWHSFDIRPLRSLLEAYQWSEPSDPNVKSVTTHLPIIGNGPTPAEPEAHIPAQPDNTWQRSWPIVLKFEGGLSLDPNDTGNWYNGQLIGTKYGISAAVWAGQYDIPNLTQAQALSIYKTAYWDAANCDALPWPLCLAVFDHAINAGVGSARQLLSQSGPNFLVFMADRIAWYTRLAQFDIYGVAWMRRCAEVLREGAK